MFKSSPFSFFWGKSTAAATTIKSANTNNTAKKDAAPQAFTISGKGAGLVKVSMVDTEAEGTDDGFVDIQCRKLSYAEVASLKPVARAIPAKGRVEKNEFEVLKQEQPQSTTATKAPAPVVESTADVLAYSAILDDELPEKFKTDNHHKKSKNKGKAKKNKKNH